MIYSNSNKYQKNTNTSINVNVKDTQMRAAFKTNLKLKEDTLVGLFTRNVDGSFKISDIRRVDFSKITFKNGKGQSAIVYHPKNNHPKDNQYYEFGWIENGMDADNFEYKFKVNDNIPLKILDERSIVERLHDQVNNYPAGAGGKIVKMLDTLKTQLTASGKEIFIYELLQNANDYPVKKENIKQPVEVEFHILSDALVFMHSGDKFNAKNIAAICGINDGEKTDNKETIGYKGIGFKTVFIDNNYVYLQSGRYSLRFDEKETRLMVDTPYQILPYYTEYNELTKAEKRLFTNADKRFRVRISLHPINKEILRESKQNYVKMFGDIFKNERVILFIPYVSSVKVFWNHNYDQPDICCTKNNEHWHVDSFKAIVPEEVTNTLNNDIENQENTGGLKIPTKYKDFQNTEVSFACAKDVAELKEVENANLYCYLPTKADWGFRFLMNTDMIPTGPRDDIEVQFDEGININAEIAKIAGDKFFDWINRLCGLKQYKAASIFSLIPVFDTCIKEHKKYKNLIEEFQDGFENRLRNDAIIPVADGHSVLLTDTLLDRTGLLSSGVISDQDFLSLSGIKAELPIGELRKDSYFKDFLSRYLKHWDKEDNIWQWTEFNKFIKKQAFIEWMKKKENNLNFMKFCANQNLSNIKHLPLINDQGDVIDMKEEHILFFSSTKGREMCNHTWLVCAHIDFVSVDYDEQTLEYLKDQYEIREFDVRILFEDIILNNTYAPHINEAIQTELAENQDFVTFCFEQRTSIPDCSLRNYALLAKNKSGIQSYQTSDAPIFFCSDDYEKEVSHKWIAEDWMFKLDNAYFDTDSYAEKKDFIQKAFSVKELTFDSFYDVMFHHAKEICAESGNDLENNIDLFAWFDLHYNQIFENHNDTSVWKKLTYYVETEISEIAYLYNKELEALSDYEWLKGCPFEMARHEYGQSPTLKWLGIKDYSFGNFFDKVIVPNLHIINGNTTTIEESVDFHQTIIKHLSSLCGEQIVKMGRAKVYLQDGSIANCASKHKIASESTAQLLAMGILQVSQLDLINQAYNPEKDKKYWIDSLGNATYSVTHFLSWMKNNEKYLADQLSQAETNLTFWRWMKANVKSEQSLKELPASLPAMLADGSTTPIRSSIFFADAYLTDAKIENFVKKLDPSANILSPQYMQPNEDIKAWMLFWQNIGVKYEVVDILANVIQNNLTKIKDDNLTHLIASNRPALEKKLGNREFLEHLKKLQVKGNSAFLPLSEATYVICREKEPREKEPMEYILLPSEVHYTDRQDKALIEDVMRECECGHLIDDKNLWIKAKLQQYLVQQSDGWTAIANVHYPLINELSSIRNKDTNDTLKYCEAEIKQIQLLNDQEQLCPAKDLTLSSVYNPFFDFQRCGLNLVYTSDSYKDNCAAGVGNFMGFLGVRRDIQKEDVNLLENYQVALYLWIDYINQRSKDERIKHLQGLIKEKHLDNIRCIPTNKEAVNSPLNLYSPSISKFVKTIKGWESHLPLESLSDIDTKDGTTLFEMLPFKKELSFEDAINSLFAIKKQDGRKQVLTWMIDGQNDDSNILVTAYRRNEKALWQNVLNQAVHISHLYALDKDDKMLQQIFGNNQHIINKEYLPRGENYHKACDLLQIKTITKDDVIISPLGQSNDNEGYLKQELRLCALVFAGIVDKKNWLEFYQGFCAKIERMRLYLCDKILIQYREDENVSNNLKEFYHEDTDSENFYYVKDWRGLRVFADFVQAFIAYLDVEINKDHAEIVMESKEKALAIVEQDNELQLDESFCNELQRLTPEIPNRLTGGRKADDADSTTSNDRIIVINDNHEFVGTDEQIEQEEYTEYADYDVPTENKKLTSQDISLSTDANFATPATERAPLISSNKTTHQSSSLPGKKNKPSITQADGLGLSKSDGFPLELDVLLPSNNEIKNIKRVLGEDLSPERIIDENYLVRYRLFNYLKDNGYNVEMDEADFLRIKSKKTELGGGKYLHVCSAKGGIFYLSPHIWKMLSYENCIICICIGNRANEFMLLRNQDDLKELIRNDDIVIKFTGKERIAIVDKLYSEMSIGSGKAYTLIRVKSNEAYNSLFGQLTTQEEENLNSDEY